MESELVNLQKRMAELEVALAAITAQRPSGRRYRMVTGMFSAAIVAIGMAVTLATGSATLTPQGPSKVAAPFEVVDGKGRTLFRVQMSASGAGMAVFFNDSGEEAAVIGYSSGSGKPTIQVLSKGVLVAGIGVDESRGGGHAYLFSKDGRPAVETFATADANGAMDIMRGGKARIELGISAVGEAGLIKLYSNTTKAETVLHGDAGLQQKNASGQPAAQLGADDNGQGYFMAMNRAGVAVSKLSVASDGSSGRVEVSHGGDVKALMGVLQNGKGDVCATGAPGKQVCLSGLAVKSLIPY